MNAPLPIDVVAPEAQPISLRDFFAAAALQGLAASAEGSVPPELYATAAYQIADAMLAARGAA